MLALSVYSKDDDVGNGGKLSDLSEKSMQPAVNAVDDCHLQLFILIFMHEYHQADLKIRHT
ncbi:hypothetical protein TSUD_205410 [Trifolium subterraneum]|uniref:Uncharacterized protein n=1 Tax=Trifolium subterraneum TaxID=3900 RepID=A0A2Z6N2S8_TRISU|nr:hypothetical protein TSUD_205410 [Trifolium subterraneum]